MSQTYNVSGLSSKQKESVFLLSLGTFLEYFDLMLYIHMSVLLNDLFFPQTDPTIAQILGAFAFASTFLFRPIGGFIIGRIGDTVGRKKTVILTTFIMAGCCVVMATLPTYAEIGIIASVVMIICRVLQGFSSMGEVTGAQLYLLETLKQPHKYIYSFLITLQGNLGAFFALAVASLALSTGLNWRLAFWIGAIIAIVGLGARTRLRETPEFLDYKKRLKIKEHITNFKHNKETLNYQIVLFSLISSFGSIAAYCGAYVYASDYMAKTLHFTTEQIINQNLLISMIVVLGGLIILKLLGKNHPVKIFQSIMIFTALCTPFIPFLFQYATNPLVLTCIQVLILLPNFCANGYDVLFTKYYPVTIRFTTSATLAGLASLQFAFVPLMFIFISKYLGDYGLLLMYIPGVTSVLVSLFYLKNLENKKGLYSEYPNIAVSTPQNTKYNYAFINPQDYKEFNIHCIPATKLIEKISSLHKVTIDIKLVEKAIIFAKKWHDKQYRKSGEPFYSHPFAVAEMVSEYIPTTNAMIAAILHDIVEDTECTTDLITKEFNPRIAEIVYRLTRIRVDAQGNKIKLSVEALINEIKQLDDKEALLIKEIDRLHNLYTIASFSDEKQLDTVDETLNNIVPNIAYSVDELNVNDKLKLEDDILKNCDDILKKQQLTN